MGTVGNSDGGGMKRMAPLLLVAVSFVWGATFPWVKLALSSFSPLYWIAFRFALAAVLFGLVYLREKGSGWSDGMREGVVLGLILGSSFMLQTIGIRLSSAATMGLLTGLILPFILVIEAFVGKTKLNRKVTLSLVTAFIGFLLLSWERGMRFKTADIIGVAASVGFAFQIFLTGRFAPHHKVSSLNFYEMLTISVLAFAAAFVFEDASRLDFTNMTALSSIVFTAVFCSFFAFLIQTWAQKFVSSAKTTLFLSLEPLFAALVSWTVFYREITAAKILGATLMLSSVILVQIKD